MIELTFMGVPVAKGRPRFGNGRTYTPAKTLKAEKAIQDFARHKVSKPLEGALGVLITFYMPIPVSWPKKRKSDAVGAYHISRPDADNLKKLVLDALNGVAWLDDSQVADVRAIKVYGDEPKTTIRIWKLRSHHPLLRKPESGNE